MGVAKGSRRMLKARRTCRIRGGGAVRDQFGDGSESGGRRRDARRRWTRARSSGIKRPSPGGGCGWAARHPA
jgi:hypothetical protein